MKFVIITLAFIFIAEASFAQANNIAKLKAIGIDCAKPKDDSQEDICHNKIESDPSNLKIQKIDNHRFLIIQDFWQVYDSGNEARVVTVFIHDTKNNQTISPKMCSPISSPPYCDDGFTIDGTRLGSVDFDSKSKIIREASNGGCPAWAFGYYKLTGDIFENIKNINGCDEGENFFTTVKKYEKILGANLPDLEKNNE